MPNALKYRSITRAATAAVMKDEAEFYDAAINSDGSDAVIDFVVGTNGDNSPKYLTTPVIRGRPKQFVRTGGDGVPTQTDPKRTQDIFCGLRALLGYADALKGHTMRTSSGETYTISFLKAHEIAGVPYFVEIHADLNDGMFLPIGRGAVL